jgi:hypothetical protein
MNLLLRSLRNASAIVACGALHCSSKHGCDNDNDVRLRHMGQVMSSSTFARAF